MPIRQTDLRGKMLFRRAQSLDAGQANPTEAYLKDRTHFLRLALSM
jgi:hypothetical protein